MHARTQYLDISVRNWGTEICRQRALRWTLHRLLHWLQLYLLMLLILYILRLPLILMSTVLSPTYDPLLANNPFLLFMALYLLKSTQIANFSWSNLPVLTSWAVISYRASLGAIDLCPCYFPSLILHILFSLLDQLYW